MDVVTIDGLTEIVRVLGIRMPCEIRAVHRISEKTIVQRLNTGIVASFLRQYAAAANIDYLNAHSFRHRKAHEILRKGGSLADVMNILGHASLESSVQYTVMVDDELSSRARAFLANPGERVAIHSGPLAERYEKCYSIQ